VPRIADAAGAGHRCADGRDHGVRVADGDRGTVVQVEVGAGEVGRQGVHAVLVEVERECPPGVGGQLVERGDAAPATALRARGAEHAGNSEPPGALGDRGLGDPGDLGQLGAGDTPPGDDLIEDGPVGHASQQRGPGEQP
jgi:hypothetical protein